MNLAVGGYWPGYPDGSTVFPQQMLIDYVRVNAWNTGGGGGGDQIIGYANKCIDVPGGLARRRQPVATVGLQRYGRPAVDFPR